MHIPQIFIKRKSTLGDILTLLLISTVTNKCKPPKFLNYRICMKHKTLCNCLCFSYPTSSSHDFARVIRNIRLFGAKNYFTDHRVAHRIYSFRDSVPVLKILDCYWDMQKFEQHFILILHAIASYKARALCCCKQPTSNCIYLFKLYDKSIIILLANVLACICSEISKI